MKRNSRNAIATSAVLLACSGFAAASPDQPPNNASQASESDSALPEIVVTAEKQAQPINDVPMTITAATGDELTELGVSVPTDLQKVVPSLSVSTSAWGVPVYTLRGVGFYDNSLGAVPAVTIYVDEVPLTYSQTTEFALLDVDRVEVLKGPQGTLYGQNSTGGAVNFIAAKPTKSFAAGLDARYGRFNDLDADGFISGAITDGLDARFAINHEGADGWQQSLTRPNDTLGRKDITNGRLLLDWEVSPDLLVRLNANAGEDKSDTQAPQFEEINPVSAVAYDTDKAASPALFNTPPAPDNDRAADWDPGVPFRKDNTMYQIATTVTYSFADDLNLTSISSFDHFDSNSRIDGDGTPFEDLRVHDTGDITSAYQELRLADSTTAELHWLAGANYESDHINEDEAGEIPASYLGAFGSTANTSISRLKNTSASGYGNIDYSLPHAITLHAGVRYTDQQHDFSGCTTADDATTSALFTVLDGTYVPVGGCLTLAPYGRPGVYSTSARESNVSWHSGMDWKPTSDDLLYLTISKGYKGGSFPNIAASEYLQDRFVKQESLVDFELGTKSAWLHRRLQLNVATFYYLYDDKQVLGDLIDPATGASLPALVNVPKSTVLGGELQATWRPLDGLTLDVQATYADSRITDYFQNIDFLGASKDFRGESLPLSPLWSSIARGDYEYSIATDWLAFVGATVRFEGRTNSALGDEPLASIDSYTLLDVRGGIRSADGRLTIELWGENVANRYYWTSVIMPIDAIARYAGMPATYGIRLDYRY